MRTVETFAVIGGDLRSTYLAGALAEEGSRVISSGFDSAELPACVTACTNPTQAIGLADCVILPLPVSTDGIHVNAPFSRIPIPLETVVQALREDQLLLGGQISEALRRDLTLRGLTAGDYFSREELAVLNAVPTAEGAIQLAMEELPIDLAARPGGVDFNAAAQLRLKTIWALSLPGRVAPKSAGTIIKQTILNMIKEESEWNSK